MSSKELKAEAQSLGEIGFANQGLYDQRLGLQWVRIKGIILRRKLATDGNRSITTSISLEEINLELHLQENLLVLGLFSLTYAPTSQPANMHSSCHAQAYPCTRLKPDKKHSTVS